MDGFDAGGFETGGSTRGVDGFDAGGFEIGGSTRGAVGFDAGGFETGGSTRGEDGCEGVGLLGCFAGGSTRGADGFDAGGFETGGSTRGAGAGGGDFGVAGAVMRGCAGCGDLTGSDCDARAPRASPFGGDATPETALAVEASIGARSAERTTRRSGRERLRSSIAGPFG